MDRFAIICFDILFLDIYHSYTLRIPPKWKESLIKEYNSNNRSFIYWILSRYSEDSPQTQHPIGSTHVHCTRLRWLCLWWTVICLNLRILTVVYNITHRQIKLFLTITKETCILVHSSKNNAQLVSGQGPGTTTGLTRLLCLNSQYLQPFVPSHPPLHMCPTPGPLAKWQAHAPVIERCWQGATW